MLTFEESTHRYFWNDKLVPSVTQILREWIEVSVYGNKYFFNTLTGLVISAEVFKAAGDYGTAVHKGSKIVLEGGALDLTMLHPSLYHPLAELKLWLDQYNPRLLEIERPMFSPKLGYAGTPDIICRIGKRNIVVDIKTGAYGMAGPQTAGYEQLYREETKFWRSLERAVLVLPDKGAFKFVLMNNPADWGFFQARQYQYNFLR